MQNHIVGAECPTLFTMLVEDNATRRFFTLLKGCTVLPPAPVGVEGRRPRLFE